METGTLSSLNTEITTNLRWKNKFKTTALVCYFIAQKEQDITDYNALRYVMSKSIISKKWRGYITLTKHMIKIKSFNGHFKGHYKYDDIRGVFSPSQQSSELTLMIESKHLYYFMLFLKTDKHTKSILDIIDQNKGYSPSQVQTRRQSVECSEVATNSDAPTTEIIQHQVSNEMSEPVPVIREVEPIRYIPVQQTTLIDYNSPPKPQQSVTSVEYNLKTSPSNYIFNGFQNGYYSSDAEASDSDVNASSDEEEQTNGQWLENVTIIEYKPTLGRHIESETGSVYMFSAHQLAPKLYYSDSDSD